jgi:hypothetical protein
MSAFEKGICFMIKDRFWILKPATPLASVLAGATALAVLAGPAAAAGPNCQTMMRSFDRVVAQGGTAPKVAEAKKHRKAGAAALATGDEKACLKSMELAHTSISDAQRFMAIEEPNVAQ